MLCSFSIENNILTISFKDLCENIIHNSAPKTIIFNDIELVKIPKSKQIEKDILYKFNTIDKTKINIPKITAKYNLVDNIIYLSPIFSFLLDPQHVKGKSIKNKKGKMILLNELALSLSKKGVIVSSIIPENIIENNSYIDGYIYNNDMKWTNAVFPLPKVIYNQISSRKWENLSISKNAKNIITNNSNIHFFNDCFLDKFKSYNQLKGTPNLKKYLLDTCEYSIENFKQMIKKHTMLFLKPINSSLGKGIWQYSFQDNIYILKTKIKNNIITFSTDNIDKLINYFQLQNKNKNYLIQQGINLLTYDDRVFDIRVLVQKDKNGNWSTTGVGVRVAPYNGFMTHVPNGGEIMNLNKILAYAVQNKNLQKKILKQLSIIPILVASTIENKTKKHFAELSLDIGINDDLNLYLIEINSKPMKFDEIEIQNKWVTNMSNYILKLINI